MDATDGEQGTGSGNAVGSGRPGEVERGNRCRQRSVVSVLL